MNDFLSRISTRKRQQTGGEGLYQASLTEVILRVESLLTQAHQTFSWTWVSERPVARSGEGGERHRERLRERERERERVKGAVRGSESPETEC